MKEEKDFKTIQEVLEKVIKELKEKCKKNEK